MKLGFISLGCPKNLVDSEVMLGIIEKYKIKITNKPDEADIIIVNTCGFIESAKRESVETILSMAAYKTEGCCKYLIVTGCLAQRYAQELFQDMPEVDAIVGTNVYKDIAGVITRVIKGERILHLRKDDMLPLPKKTKQRTTVSLQPGLPEEEKVLADPRKLTTAWYMAYLKIA